MQIQFNNFESFIRECIAAKGDGTTDDTAAFAKAIGRPLDDMLLAWMTEPAGAATSACWFWGMRGLNALADAWDITGITRRINPGMAGAMAREMACASVRAVLDVPMVTPKLSDTNEVYHFQSAPVSSAISIPPHPDLSAQNIVPEDEADALMAAELAQLNPPTGA